MYNRIHAFFSIREKGSEAEKKWAATYDRLEEIDHKTELDLVKSLLKAKYRLNVPEDLHQIAYDEIMEDAYYILPNKKEKQKRIRSRYVRDWFRNRNWKNYVLPFKGFVMRQVRLKENLGANEITFEHVANFFEHRRGFIRHPKPPNPRYVINPYDMVTKFHEYIHKIEKRISGKLNFVENDSCCVEKTMDEDDDGARPTYPAISDPDPWTSDPSGVNDATKNIETTAKPWFEPTETASWNVETTPDDWSVDGSGDSETNIDDVDVANNDYDEMNQFGDENNEEDFNFDDNAEEEEEEEDDFGFDDDDW